MIIPFLNFFVTRKYTKPARKTRPRSLAQTRWNHSQKDEFEIREGKMLVNVFELVGGAVFIKFHLPGGIVEGRQGSGNGLHSVIDRPDSVSRVIPPNIT